jgi:hypothetical protein
VVERLSTSPFREIALQTPFSGRYLLITLKTATEDVKNKKGGQTLTVSPLKLGVSIFWGGQCTYVGLGT